MSRKTEEMSVRLARALWEAGEEVDRSAPDGARKFYLAQSDRARGFLAEEIKVYAENLVAACVGQGHRGSRAASGRSSAAPCRICGRNVASLRNAAKLIDLERH